MSMRGCFTSASVKDVAERPFLPWSLSSLVLTVRVLTHDRWSLSMASCGCGDTERASAMAGPAEKGVNELTYHVVTGSSIK